MQIPLSLVLAFTATTLLAFVLFRRAGQHRIGALTRFEHLAFVHQALQFDPELAARRFVA